MAGVVFKETTGQKFFSINFKRIYFFYPPCSSLFNSKDYSISVKEVYMYNGTRKEDILINSILVKEKKEGIEI